MKFVTVKRHSEHFWPLDAPSRRTGLTTRNGRQA